MLKNNARILLMFLSSIVIVGLISSCNKTIEPDLSDFGYEYFPIEIGQYRTYYSMRIDYNLDGSIDTTQYLTKEIVEDTVVYSDGSKRYLFNSRNSDHLCFQNSWKFYSFLALIQIWIFNKAS